MAKKLPSWNVQVKVMLVADVDVEAGTLEQALELAKSWESQDIVKMDSAATESTSKVQVLGIYSNDDWGV